MMYRRLCKTVSDKYYKLVDANTDFIALALKDSTTDYYTSIFMYNEEQYAQFKASGSIRGIDDVSTNWLVWDFDAKGNFELVRNDVLSLTGKLQSLGLAEDDFKIFFSGSKGFHVEMHTTSTFSVKEFKAITKQLANGLESYDKRINDHARAFRIPGSKHQTTGLYKIPLYIDDLKTVSESDLLAFASSTTNVDPSTFKFHEAILPKAILDLKAFEEAFKVEVKEVDVGDIDWTIKPKFLTNCRFSLQNGVFGAGDRNNALLCLAATYKNQGFDQEITYRMLKGVAELQAKRNGGTRYSDSELYNNIILQVYSESWSNGQFTCRDQGNWLHDYCQSLGNKKCSHKATEELINTAQVFNLFKEYTEKYEDNVLFSGIKELDKHMKFMVGTSNAILAPPGVGKTSLCLQILEYNSMNDIPCLFYSYDMFHSALYMRMFQKESGMNQDDVYKYFIDNPDKISKFAASLNDKYRNVQFCFKAGQTIDELESTIVDATEKLGRKPKLVIVDYNELVMTGISDSTASSAVVAQRLRQIANQHEVCVITLVQPAKQYCSPADEITNYNSVKGSSAIVQSLTLLLGCSRPGFDPIHPEQDNFFNITCLKNRNGPLFSLDFSWSGLRGKIDSLDDSQRHDLMQIRQQKEQKKSAESGGGWG